MTVLMMPPSLLYSVAALGGKNPLSVGMAMFMLVPFFWTLIVQLVLRTFALSCLRGWK